MSSMHRQRVVRADGRSVNIVQRRAHLSYCFTGCCCGRIDRGYAEVPHGKDAHGVDARPIFAQRLRSVHVALHNQDNREHDIFDSDDYFQFHGGMIASIRALTGVQPKAYFGDSSPPEEVRVRDLREEALRVYRSRVVNPKWLDAIKRHRYKGCLEMTATVDYISDSTRPHRARPILSTKGWQRTMLLTPVDRRS